MDATLEVISTIVRIPVALVFVGMGVTHFVPGVARGMAAMIPPVLRRRGVPSPMALVLVTGVCEIAGGIGLLVPQTRFAAAASLVVFLVAVFPANAFAAEHREKFGRAAIPFWPRYVAQLVLIALVIVAGMIVRA